MPDLRAVDYKALAMLNLSATQELSKQVAAQQAEIDALKKANARLATLAGQIKELQQLAGIHPKTSGAKQPAGNLLIPPKKKQPRKNFRGCRLF